MYPSRDPCEPCMGRAKEGKVYPSFETLDTRYQILDTRINSVHVYEMQRVNC